MMRRAILSFLLLSLFLAAGCGDKPEETKEPRDLAWRTDGTLPHADFLSEFY